MAWDWTSPTLDPVALVRVRYRDAAGVPKYARWSGPEGRAESGVMAEDPDGLTSDVHPWEPRLAGGMTIEESLGPIDRPELSVGSLSLRVRCPASSPNGESDALRSAVLNGRWERADVVVWLYDLDSGATREVYRGRAPKGISPMDDEQFTLQTEALPFSLPDITVPHTRIPDNVDDYSVFAGFPYGTTFTTPAVYAIHEKDRGTAVGPVIGDPVGNETYGWIRVVPFGYRSLGTPAGDFDFHCHVSPLLGVVAFDAAVEGDSGSVIISDANSPSNDYIRPYENAVAAYGPIGSNVVIQVPASENPSADWISEGRAFYVRCYGYRSGLPDVGNEPYYQYSVNAAGELSIPSPNGMVQRYDEVLEDVLEDAAWAGLTSVYGLGSIGALYTSAPFSSASFDNIATSLGDSPAEDPMLIRDLLAGMCLGLGFDLCPRVDPADGVIRLFPLWRKPQSASEPATWDLFESDLQKQSPPRSIKLVFDPDRVYGNTVTVRGHKRNAPRVDGLPDDEADELQDSRTLRIASEIAAVGEEYRTSVEVKHWQPKPLVSGTTPSGFGAIASFRIAKDCAQKQPVVVAKGGLPLARVQLGDTVAWNIEGYPSAPGQVRSRTIDVLSGDVTLRSHHIVFWDIFNDSESFGQND